MFNLLEWIWIGIGGLFLYYSIYVSFHILVGIIGYKTPLEVLNTHETSDFSTFAVVIPAFKPDFGFPERVQRIAKNASFLKMKVMIVLQQSTQEMYDALSAYSDFLFSIEKPLVQSGNPYHAILRFTADKLEENGFSHLILLDMDNEIDSIGLRKIASQLIENDLVQGKRIAKTSESNATSTFDILSESLNDVMMRASRYVLGYPIELSGSGFGVSVSQFKNATYRLDSRAPGMDKNLLIQFLIQNPNFKMVYDDSICITDEKTTSEQAFGRQRLRWFGNQYFNAIHYSGSLFRLSFKTLNPGFIDYAISLWRPPRSFQIPILLFGFIIEVILINLVQIQLIPIFTLGFFVYGIGIALFLFSNRNEIEWNTITSLFRISFNVIFIALKSLSPKLRGTFIHTRTSSSNEAESE